MSWTCHGQAPRCAHWPPMMYGPTLTMFGERRPHAATTIQLHCDRNATVNAADKNTYGVYDYVTLGRFALIPGLWRKVGLGRGGGGWDGVGHVGGRD